MDEEALIEFPNELAAHLPTPNSRDTVIQLKLYDRAVDFWKRRYKDRRFAIKITPVSIRDQGDNDMGTPDLFDGQESSNINDHLQDGSIVKICALNDQEASPRAQEQFGHRYDADEFVVFVTEAIDSESVTFMVEFYADNETNGYPIPERIGFCYILPSNLRGTSGSCTMPITGKKHLPIGQLSLEYLMIRPLFGVDHGSGAMNHWKPLQKLDVGVKHRVENVLENTVASFNYAASHGADMVELDVQLTKDLVPVIYHDYFVNIAMKKKRSREDHEFLQIPVKDLSLDQLHLLKLSPVHKHDRQDNQPFPTLEHILEAVDERCGFNVEIKYPMKRQDGSWDGIASDRLCDLNEYVDIILRVLFSHAKNRHIIISCFHPDICSLVASKQTKYSLLFLTQGKTEKWQPFFDPRTRSVQMAAFTAKSLGFTGVNVHAEDLLKDRSLIEFVKSRGLVLFVWGDDLNDKQVIKQLKVDGVDGVVYDKIDELSCKEPIFIADTNGDKKVLRDMIASSGNEGLLHSSAFSWTSSTLSTGSGVSP